MGKTNGSSTATNDCCSIERVDIVETGIYEFHKVGAVILGPNTATGIITQAMDRKLLKATTTVPGRVGNEFGLRFVVIGKPKGAIAKITCITKFPAQGLRNPSTGKTVYQSEFEMEVEIGKPILRAYAIESDWEVVPGKWALEFWCQGRKLGGQTFTVVAT